MTRKKSNRAAQGAGTIRKKTVHRKGGIYTYWEARITVGHDPGTGRQIQRSFSGKTQKEVREKMQASRQEENSEILFEGGRLVWNRQADRLQILFDGIPDDARRRELKSNGFRWSPKNKAWQRQLTMNAVRAAKRMLNLQDV